MFDCFDCQVGSVASVHKTCDNDSPGKCSLPSANKNQLKRMNAENAQELCKVQERELKSCDASGSSIAAIKDICVMTTSSFALPSNGLEKGKAKQTLEIWDVLKTELQK